MAYPTFRSAAQTQIDATSNNLTITKPAGTANGDLLVAFILMSDYPTLTGPIGAPAGWTALNTQLGVGIWVSGYYYMARAYYRIASSEGASYTWTKSGSGSGATYSNGLILCYQNPDPAAPIDVAIQAVVGANGVSHTVASITTTQDGCLRVDGVAPHTPGHTWTPDASTTERDGGLVFGGDEQRASAGATGTRTHVASTSRETVKFVLALSPAALPAGQTVGMVPI